MQPLPSLRIFLASLTLVAVACGKDDGDSGAAQLDGTSADDQAMAEALWAEIDGYESWSQLDPWVGIVASTDVPRLRADLGEWCGCRHHHGGRRRRHA